MGRFFATIKHGRIATDGRTEESLRKGRKPAPGSDQKRHFLATMDAELIKNLKLVAIEDETSASECLEEAAIEWLERRKSKAKKASEK